MEYFKKSMLMILNEELRNEVAGEQFADQQLSIATGAEMSKKLKSSRMKGRHGWWDENVCTIDQLYAMRSMALLDNDHVSVINFTAMIAARESVQKQPR